MRIVGGMGVFTVGLDYAACAVILERYGLDDIEVWEGLRIIEAEFVRVQNEKSSK